MKLKVLTPFRDRTDHVTVYAPETILEVKDRVRRAELVRRGLCAVYRGGREAQLTL